MRAREALNDGGDAVNTRKLAGLGLTILALGLWRFRRELA